MKMRKWEEIPDFMRIPEVRPYYDILMKKIDVTNLSAINRQKIIVNALSINAKQKFLGEMWCG